MEELSPEQKEQLSNWSIQRDALLTELALLKEENEKLTQRNIEIADSSTEISEKIQQSIGRMEELDKQENLYKEIVAVEIPALEIVKTRLQTEITALKKEVVPLETRKEELVKDIEFLIKTKEDVSDKKEIIEKVVDHVTKVNSSNIKEIDEAIIALKSKVDEILKLSTEDIDAHNKILGEIPKLFVELQRKSLVREKI